jgi:hypothetical protein
MSLVDGKETAMTFLGRDPETSMISQACSPKKMTKKVCVTTECSFSGSLNDLSEYSLLWSMIDRRCEPAVNLAEKPKLVVVA